MPRRCCVKSCLTSYGNSDNNYTLFAFPEEWDVILRQMWLNAIGTNLKMGKAARRQLYICELHFKPEFFEQNDINLIKDGSEISLPRRRKRLKKKSVPSIFNAICEETTKTQVPREDGKNTPNVNENFKGSGSITSTETQSTEVKIDIPQCIPNVKMLLPISKEKPCLLPHALVEVKQFPQLIPSPISIEGETPRILYFQTIPTKEYSLDHLRKDWANLPIGKRIPGWFLSETNDGLKFSYTENSDVQATRSIHVHHDMTVKVFEKSRLVNYHLLNKVRRFSDLCSALRVIKTLQICLGSHENTACPNGFYLRKPHSSSDRCRSCQFKRKRENDIERKREKRRTLKCEGHKILVTYIKEERPEI